MVVPMHGGPKKARAEKTARRRVSLRNWLFAVISLLTLPLLVVMLFVSIYTGNEMRRQALANNDHLLSVYVRQLDTSVSGLNSFLASLPLDNADMLTLMTTRDPQAHYFASINILDELKIDMMLYDRCDGLFVYSEGPLRNELLCQSSGGNTSGDIRFRVTDMILSDEKNTNGWELKNFGGYYYLIRIIRNGSNYCGAWINVNSLSLPLDVADSAPGARVVVTDKSGSALESSVRAAGIASVDINRNGSVRRIVGANYLQIAKTAQQLPVAFTILIPDSVFTASIRSLQRVILLSFFAVLLLLPVFGYTLNRMLYRPVRTLTEAMGRAERGDLSVRTAVDGQFSEFNNVSAHFNTMLAHIQRLKEDVYDRTIREQRMQLQYLQLQIRPHFFLNMINVIYSFSLVRRNDLIEQTAIALGRHFRYLFRNPMEYVTVRAEIGHIENYMEIQELRYAGRFRYTQQVDEALLERLIPPFSVQTFIENSIKHGLGSDGHCTIELNVKRRVENDREPQMEFRVRDNGPGYPPEVLRALEAKRPLGSDPTKHIGIRNLRARLRLLYGEQAELQFGNNPEGGAFCRLLLPLEAPAEDSTRVVEMPP